MLNLHIPAVIRSPDVGRRRRAFEYGIALLEYVVSYTLGTDMLQHNNIF